jgi:ribosomal protein RSM22 (predicted rRNA methylase)
VTQLPASIRQTLDALLTGRARRDLAERSQAISAHYRESRNSNDIVRSADDALAYATARLPATFAAMAFALEQLARASPELKPRTLLDIGCGPGAAAIAALGAFPGIETLDLMDRNGPFLELAKRLVPGFSNMRALRFETLDITSRDALPGAELIVAGYIFAELFEGDVVESARRLWFSAGKALVIAEPGTPEGFRRIRAVREALIAEGAHVAAPCTHEGACPMQGEAWCRVPVRLQRSRDHRVLKGGALGHEDEPLAYLALTKEAPPQRAAYRIVGPAQRTKGEIRLPVCGSAGLRDIPAPARDRILFKRFRKLDWGDAVEKSVQQPAEEKPR